MIRALFAATPALRPALFGTLAALAAATLSAPAQAAVDIQEVTSPGGIHAWLVEEHSIPFTALEIRFRGGASLDLPGKRGATNLMMATLEEGAAGLDAQGFAEAREALAASYGFDTGDDTVAVSARMLTENRDQAVALLRKALIEPSFSQEAIDRVKAQVLSSIESDARDPSALAGEAFGKLAFGDHPYATSIDGTAESLAALTRDDLVAAKANVMARDRIYVSAVGDITPADLGKLLDDLLGALPATGAPMPPEAKLGLTGGVTVVPFDTPQSVVMFAEAGLKRDDPDFFAAYTLNQIVGGSGFSSRLMQEVREKRGLTYGAYSYLVPMDHAELWQGSFASSNDKVAEAVQVTRDVWADVAKNGVTQDELDKARTYLLGSYPLRFDGNAAIAAILVGMQLDHLPVSYVTTRDEAIKALTLADLDRVAKRLMKPENLRFVVVGQPKGLAAAN